MSEFLISDELLEGDDDIIVIHLGQQLTDEQYERVLNSVIAFLNVRWPDLAHIGIDN